MLAQRSRQQVAKLHRRRRHAELAKPPAPSKQDRVLEKEAIALDIMTACIELQKILRLLRIYYHRVNRVEASFDRVRQLPAMAFGQS